MELVRDHGRDLAQIREKPVHGPRRTRLRVLLGTTAGLAGLGTILALLLGVASSSPAFAVTRNSDGTVTVWVARVGGLAGANARLAQLGVHAKAIQVTAGCAAAGRAGVVKQRGGEVVGPGKVQKLIVKARVDPERIPAGHTLVLSAARRGAVASVSPAHLVRGVAPPCFPGGAPPLPPAVFRGGAGRVHCVMLRGKAAETSHGFRARDAKVV